MVSGLKCRTGIVEDGKTTCVEERASETPTAERSATAKSLGALPRGAPRSFAVTLEQTGETFLCREDEAVLKDMARLGKRAIPVGCVNGGCGICKVEVLSGEFVSGPMSRTHVSEEEERRGFVLACKILPRSNLRLRVVGKVAKFVGVLASAPRAGD